MPGCSRAGSVTGAHWDEGLRPRPAPTVRVTTPVSPNLRNPGVFLPGSHPTGIGRRPNRELTTLIALCRVALKGTAIGRDDSLDTLGLIGGLGRYPGSSESPCLVPQQMATSLVTPVTRHGRVCVAPATEIPPFPICCALEAFSTSHACWPRSDGAAAGPWG